MMRCLLVLSIAWLATMPALAQNAPPLESLEDIRRAVQALSERVARLEAENAELRARNQRLESAPAESRPVATASAGGRAEVPKSVEWASRLSWKGDLRYRHEHIDADEANNEQDRHRIRARFGLTARVSDTLTGTVQLASGGGNSDPRSTNQTLGSGWTRKEVAIDQAYFDWQALEGLNVQLGKMPLPFVRSGSYFWDNDLMPEGAAARFSRGPLFASAFGYWLNESGNGRDSGLLGGQVGLRHEIGGIKLSGAAGYYDVTGVEMQVTTAVADCAPNGAFFGGPQGNSTVLVAGCPRLLNDFDMYQLLGQAEMEVAGRPLTLFADFIRNAAADELDTGYALGLTYGRAGDPGTWEVGYTWQETEKNAVFGQFVDSDFGGGITDVEGSALKLGFAPVRGWILNGTFFFNDRFVDAGTERDYRRLQLDLNWRF